MPSINWPTFVAMLFLVLVGQLVLLAGILFYVAQIAKEQARHHRIIRNRMLSE